MKKIQGTVKKKDVEGGVWVLETDRKEVFQLKGGPPDLYQNNFKVKIEGNVRKDMMSIGMSGPIFEVKKVL